MDLTRFADIPFPARITEWVELADPHADEPRRHGFVEQALLATGEYADADDGRRGRCGLPDGTGAVTPAVELNGRPAAVDDLVMMKLRGCVRGEPYYEFEALPQDTSGVVEVTNATLDSDGYYAAKRAYYWHAGRGWTYGPVVLFKPSNGEALELNKRYLGHYEDDRPVPDGAPPGTRPTPIWASDRF